MRCRYKSAPSESSSRCFGRFEPARSSAHSTGANTAYVAQQLAEAAGVQEKDVGQALPGDVRDDAGRPTRPLWGRDRLSTPEPERHSESAPAAFEGGAPSLG